MKKLFYLLLTLLISQQIFAQHFTITTANGHLIITDVAGNQDLLGITQNGSNIRFAATGRNYSLNGGPTTNFPVEIALAGLQTITINGGDGQDLIELGDFSSALPSLTIDGSNGQDLITVGALSGGVASLTINGGSGNDLVIMEGDITFAPNGNLDLDLQNDDATPGIDAVTFADNANILLSGTGTATVKVSKNLTINTGSSLITQNGSLTLEANQQATPTIGDFVGIDINGGTLKVTGNGQANVKGKSGTVGYKSGISVNNGGVIEGGTAQLSVMGTGGTADGNENNGVLVTGTNSKITSSGGNVSVTGQGGGLAGGYNQHGVVVETLGMITAGATGSVTVQGTGAGITDGSTFGVHVNGGTVTSSGGNVSVTGQGGSNGNFFNNYGVYLESSGLISAGGTGTVTVQGMGGNSSEGHNLGIYLEASSVTSANGNISLTGQAGGESGSSSNDGILLDAVSQISAGGTGSIYMEGTGSASSFGFNYGINIEDNNSQIITNNGNIQLVGVGGNGTGTATGDAGINADGAITAGGTGTIYLQGTGGRKPFSHGVIIDSPVTTNDGTITLIGVGGADATAQYGSYGVDIVGTVTAGNGKAITVQGTGGGSTGLFNAGVSISRANALSSTTGGTIQVTGIEGGSGTGIFIDSEGSISTLTNGGNITLITNSIAMAGTSAINTNTASSVTLRSYSNGVGIDLGAATNPLGGPLNLTDAELDRITTGTINVGDVNSGAITVSAAISRTANTAMNLTSGGAVNLNASSLNTNGGNLNVNAAAGINPTAAGTDATVGTASFTAGNDLNIVINGITADTDYRQLNIAGSVNLTGLDLVLTGNYIPVGSETFTIVNNDGSEAITGTFNGLSQGAAIANFLGSSLSATIMYNGGDGNDAVIKVQCPAFPAPTASVTVQPTCTTPTGTIVVTAPTGGNIQYSVNGSDYQTSAGFSGLNPATYSVTAKNTATGCISTALPLTVNAGSSEAATVGYAQPFSEEGDNFPSSVGENFLYGYKVTITKPIQVTSFSAILPQVYFTGGARIRFALYSNENNAPKILVASSAGNASENTPTLSAGLNTFALDNPVTLSCGEYWICFVIKAPNREWFLYSPNGPVGQSINSPLNFGTAFPTTYNLTVNDNANFVYNVFLSGTASCGPAAPSSVGVSATSVCSGTNVTLSATCPSGTVQWYSGPQETMAIGTNTGLSVSPTATATYYASCKEGALESCRIAAPVVTVTSSITLSLGAVTQPTSCGVNNGSIGFTTNLANGSYSLSYTGAGSPQTITVAGGVFVLTGLTAGTYSHFSVSVNGCTGTEPGSRTLNGPTPITPLPATLCSGLTLTLSPGSGGSWQSSNSQIATVTNQGLVTGVSAGSVYFTFTETATGCSVLTSTVQIKPTPSSALTASKVDVCPNSEVTLDAHCSLPTATVHWNPGAPTVTPDAATIPYLYKASCVADGCVGNESSVEVRTHRILVDMKDLDVGTLPLPIARAVKDNLAPTNVINAPVFPRRWTFIATGCNASESAVFRLLGPVSFQTVDNEGMYAMFGNDGGGFYSLDHPNYGNGGSFPNGTYTLTVDLRSSDGVGGPFPKNRVAAGSLLATRSLQFTVQNPVARMGMSPEPFAAGSEGMVQVIPNPVVHTMRLHVSDSRGETVNIELLDTWGRNLLQGHFVALTDEHQEEFDLSHLANGLYFLRVKTRDQQNTLKIVKVQ